MDKAHINIATQPHRVHTLEKTIESLYNQADKINVVLNGFESIPKFLKKKKINIISDGNDYGAAGKFYSLGKVQGYYFTADDDLIYGRDHINYLKHMIELYKRQAVVGVHATMYARHPIQSYYTDKGRIIYYAVNGNSQNRFVHMLATNGIGFHTDTLPKLKLKHFPEKRMVDPYFTKYAIEHNIPQVVLTHAAGWIKLQSTDADEGAIWKDVAKNDTKQTEVINSIKNFKLVTAPFIDRANVDTRNPGSLEERAIIEIFRTIDKGTILEFGSGKGTDELVKFYNMISIEHDVNYLNKYKSTYIHAPIKDGFYDLKKVTIPEYDLLIIDGPPANFDNWDTQEGRKWFRSHFVDFAKKFDLSKPILIDDVDREDEKKLLDDLVELTGRKAKIIDGKRKKFALI